MRRTLVGLLLVAAAAVGTVALASDERVRVRLSGPRATTAGAQWTAVLTVTPTSAGRPTLVARAAGRSRSARGVRTGRGRWRVTLSFPSAGRWTLAARLGRSSYPLGAVTVRAGSRPVELNQPGGIAIAPDGSLVVAVQGENRLIRIDPATGVTQLVAAVPRPWGVAVASDGAILFSSASDVMRREPDGRTTTIARFPVDAGPVAISPGGDVFVGVADHRIYRIRGAAVEPYAGTGADLSSPHGFAFPTDGSLLASDTGFDRIVRVDGATKAITTFADGVRVPNGIALGPDGSLYVTESQGHRVTRIDPSGRRETVAGTGVQGSSGDGGPARSALIDVPTQVAVDGSGVLYVMEWGTGHIRRVDANGTISTLRRRVG